MGLVYSVTLSLSFSLCLRPLPMIACVLFLPFRFFPPFLSSWVHSLLFYPLCSLPPFPFSSWSCSLSLCTFLACPFSLSSSPSVSFLFLGFVLFYPSSFYSILFPLSAFLSYPISLAPSSSSPSLSTFPFSNVPPSASTPAASRGLQGVWLFVAPPAAPDPRPWESLQALTFVASLTYEATRGGSSFPPSPS